LVSSLRGPDESPGAEALGSQVHHPNVVNTERHGWPIDCILPGAVREGGLDDEEGYGEDDEYTIEEGYGEEVGTIESIPPTFSAELIDPEEEERLRQEQIQQVLTRELRNALQEEHEKAAVAEVVPEVDPHKGRQWKLASLCLLLTMIVVGVVLAATLRPGPEPTTPKPTTPEPSTQAPTTPIPQDLFELISSASSDDGENLRTPSTPQNMALGWLAGNPNLANYTDQEKIQRYALATLYYSTKGERWYKSEFWLSNTDVCDNWYQHDTLGDDAKVDCTSNGAVSFLDLRFNSLQGTIPPEIGMLSDSLGKFLVEENAIKLYDIPSHG
jgi:hypothetical protein